MPIGQNSSRYHGFVHDRADAQGYVDAVLDQVYTTLGGVDVNLDIGVAALECGQQVPPRLERLGQRQPQASLQMRLVAFDGLLGLDEHLDAAAGVLVKS